MTLSVQALPSEQLTRNVRRVIAFAWLVGGFTLAFASPAAAQSLELTGPLQALVDILTGTVARLIAILAIVVYGFMMMSGRAEVKQGLMICFGIILVFGAATVVDLLTGGAGG